MAREMVAAGLGVMPGLERSLRPDLQSGRLVALDLAAPEMGMALCLALPARAQATPAVRDLAAALRAAAQA